MTSRLCLADKSFQVGVGVWKRSSKVVHEGWKKILYLKIIFYSICNNENK